MPTLTTTERNAVTTAVHTPSITGESTADLYRNPAPSGGKVGAATLTTSGIAIRVRPASQDARQMRLITLPQPMSSARVMSIGKVAQGTDVRHGDELRIGSTRYRVEGVGVWEAATLVALSEIKS